MKTEKPIDKIRVELLDAALRLSNIEINKSILDRIIDIFKLLEEKGGESTVNDFEDLKAQWKKQ